MHQNTFKISELFESIYGEHEINDKSNLSKGKNLVISSQGIDNGTYGYFDKNPKFREYVISLPRTGSIGKAFVQEYNCSIDDNCLVLIPLKSFKYTIEDLYFVCGIIRLNSWRFQYGRQITPERIGKLKIDFSLMDKVKLSKLKNFMEEIFV